MRYIDADKLQEEFKKLHGGKRLLLIDTQPTADVVEVVRCKDCKHIKEEHFNIMPDGFSCELSGLMVEPEHFCSYGERVD